MNQLQDKTTPANQKIRTKAIFAIVFLLFFTPTLHAQKPNILLIVSDDLNTRIGPYMEIDRHTPHLDRLAKEGVRFKRTYCQFPLCGPSRASFMSGLYPETNGVLNNNDQPGSYRKETPALAHHPSMAGFFRENGYFTARVSKIFHMGIPGGIERGEPGGDDPDSWDYTYNVMAPETLSPGELELLSPKNHHYGSNFARMIIPDNLEETQADYMAASQAVAILENRAGNVPEKGTNKQRTKNEAPFFLAVGFVRPHVPLIAPENCYVPYLRGKNPENPKKYAYTVSYQGKDASLRSERWRYTSWEGETGQNNEELYDHLNDPEELINLAGNPEFANTLKEMRENLNEMRKTAQSRINK